MSALAAGLASLTVLAAPSAVSEARLEIRARVEPFCAAESIEASAPDRLRLATACNTEFFRVSVDRDGAPVKIASAESAQAFVRPDADGALSVRLTAPGRQLFMLALAEPAPESAAYVVRIEAF